MRHFKQAIIRGGIPFVIMTGISLLMRMQELDAFQVKSTFITGLIVTSVAATSVLYDVKSWSLLKQSLVHFIIMLVTVLPCLILSGWFPNETIQDISKILGVFLATGVVLWGVLYLVFGKLLKRKAQP